MAVEITLFPFLQRIMNSKIVKCYKTWTVNCSGGSELSFYPGRYFQAKPSLQKRVKLTLKTRNEISIKNCLWLKIMKQNKCQILFSIIATFSVDLQIIFFTKTFFQSERVVKEQVFFPAVVVKIFVGAVIILIKQTKANGKD